jgi:hypothetical protein
MHPLQRVHRDGNERARAFLPERPEGAALPNSSPRCRATRRQDQLAERINEIVRRRVRHDLS